MRSIQRWIPAVVAVAYFALGGPPEAAAQQQSGSSLSVAEAVVTTAVQDRQPAEEVSSVPADVGRVFLWTRITGAEGEVDVVHVWYHGDEEMARVPVRVASPDWRTWTSKRILPHWTGAWRVEVQGPGGQVLETVSFQVQEGGAGR